MKNKEIKDPILIEINKLDRNVKRILWIGAPIMILMPILTTQLDWLFDFTNTGNIGDTIGGITAPVIGVVSALLIYFSFRAQINANRIIQQQFTDQKLEENAKREFNYQMELCKHIKVIIDNYECLDHANSSPEYFYKGNEALDVLLRNLSYKYQRLFNLGSDYHRFIHNVLNQFDSILDSFENKKNINCDIRLPLQLVNYLFETEFWIKVDKYVLNSIEKSDEIDENVFRICTRFYRIHIRLSLIQQTEDQKQQSYEEQIS